MGQRAIIAGSGRLPHLVAEAGVALMVRLQGQGVREDDIPLLNPTSIIDARVERLGDMFDALHAENVTEVCFAGAMTRVRFDLARLDHVTQGLLPQIIAAQGQGDDALLREIVTIFTAQGFTIRGAAELRPDLVVQRGVLAGSKTHETDAARARAVLAALGPLDVGQAAVAANGQMLGIETLQGTDAMLQFVTDTAPKSGGVLVKRAKTGQDLRVDMPAIGPETIHRAANAGLAGIELQAGAVLLLDRQAVLTACAEAELNLWAVP